MTFFRVFVTWGVTNKNIFHEYRSGGIYTISEIVSHMVLTIINSEGYFRSTSSYDINE
jgi:hypothetical protein